MQTLSPAEEETVNSSWSKNLRQNFGMTLARQPGLVLPPPPVVPDGGQLKPKKRFSDRDL